MNPEHAATSAAAMVAGRHAPPNHDTFLNPTIDEICGRRIPGLARMAPADATLALEAHRRARLDAFTDALRQGTLTSEQHARLFAWYDKNCTANWFQVRAGKVDELEADSAKRLRAMRQSQRELAALARAIAEDVELLDSFDAKYGADVVTSKKLHGMIRGAAHRHMPPAKYGELVAQAAGQDP